METEHKKLINGLARELASNAGVPVDKAKTVLMVWLVQSPFSIEYGIESIVIAKLKGFNLWELLKNDCQTNP